jgi:hypothetical protein
MGWIAGYHNTIGERHYRWTATWGEARTAVIDELDQRVKALRSDPGPHDGDELRELAEALACFNDLPEGIDGAADAGALTFVVVPDSVADLAVGAEDEGEVLR